MLVRAVAALALALVALAGCGGAGEDEGDDGEPRASRELERAEPDRGDGDRAAAPALEPVHCPHGDAGCARATGEIVYVERVDPDGDGDAHFVLLSSQGVTAPGVTVIDVARELRPRPLPEPGDLLSAAGPVYRGSYGQRQIQAIAVRVARR